METASLTPAIQNNRGLVENFVISSFCKQGKSFNTWIPRALKKLFNNARCSLPDNYNQFCILIISY